MVCKMRARVWMDFSMNPSCQPLYVLRVNTEFPHHSSVCRHDLLFGHLGLVAMCMKASEVEKTDEGGQSAGQPRRGWAEQLAVVGEAERLGHLAVGEGSKRRENRMKVRGRDGDFWLG